MVKNLKRNRGKKFEEEKNPVYEDKRQNTMERGRNTRKKRRMFVSEGTGRRSRGRE